MYFQKQFQKGCFLFLIALLFLSHTSGAQSKSPPEVRIGISLPTQRDVGWYWYRQAFEKIGKERGLDLRIQVADQDAAIQNAQIENLMAQNIDVLIIAPQDAAAATAIVNRASRAKIKVIAIDRLVVNTHRLSLYVSFDNFKVGELQGKYLVERMPKGNYVIFSGAPTDNNSALFKAGAMKHIQPLVDKGAIQIVMEQPIDNWQPSVAQRLMENALTSAKNNIQAVLAPNDNTAGGIIQALISQKLGGKVLVTGQDTELTALQRIAQGTQSMSVYKDRHTLASVALDAALALATQQPVHTNATVNNGRVEVPAVLLPAVVVDKANLNMMIDSGLFKREQIYK